MCAPNGLGSSVRNKMFIASERRPCYHEQEREVAAKRQLLAPAFVRLTGDDYKHLAPTGAKGSAKPERGISGLTASPAAELPRLSGPLVSSCASSSSLPTSRALDSRRQDQHRRC